MLNIKMCLGVFLLFILVNTGNSQTDSAHFDRICKEIQAFKFSNQKKILSARITQSINGFSETENSALLGELYNSYIQDIISNYMLDEARELLIKYELRCNLDDPADAINYYNLLGLYYRFSNEFDSALFYFNLARDNCIRSKNSNMQGTLEYSIGKTYQRSGNDEAGVSHFVEANILIKDNVYGLAQSKRRLATAYCRKKDYDTSLKLINEALKLYVSSDKSQNSIDTITNFAEYADLLQSRAYYYREKALNHSDSLNLLRLSLHDAERSILMFEIIKRTMVFESDLVALNNKYEYFNSKTIEAISRLNDVLHSDSLVYKALQYAEMDKSSALTATVQKNMALSKSGMPDSIVQDLRNRYRLLGSIEAKRFEENAALRVNDSSLFDLNMRLYDLVLNITEVEKKIEIEYPLYKELKYRINAPNLKFIIEQSYNKAIVEYVLSSEKLYCFLIVDGEIYFEHKELRSNFITSVERLQHMISDIKSLDFSLKELNEFEKLSYELYLDLLAPFDSLIGDRPLLIVPDEQLSLIPFEVLLTESFQSSSLNYSNLPYLLNSHDVTYAYSLTLMQKHDNMNKAEKKNRLLAMAPSYEKLAGNQGSQYIALRGDFRDARDKLGMLEGAQKEAELITRNNRGVLLVENRASESEFKSQAQYYRVLHLAMHTLINNENPLYSKLVFTPDVDELEDGLLNTYELNNMQLNADLVVLSACNTGFGKLNSGEGIIGLSRGFLQAGCKSLLATLWSVADKASVNLINTFYEELNNGKTKSASLSLAKRNYLKTATGINAHPFFWAGYISIGNDSPIVLDNEKNNIWVFLAVGILVLSILLWVVKRKSRKDSGFQSN